MQKISLSSPQKAIIFDLDGTLVNSLEDIADSMNNVLIDLGFTGHPQDKYKYFVGDGLKKLVQRVLPTENHDSATVEKCINMMRQEYGKRWSQKTHLYPGIADMLDSLVAKDVRLSILSNKPDNFTQIFYKKFLSNWPFDQIVGSRPEIPKKPDPCAALNITEYLKIDPRQVIYVGDTNTDMQTAQAAGMFPVGVLWGFRKEAELNNSGAAVIIKNPNELLDLI